MSLDQFLGILTTNRTIEKCKITQGESLVTSRDPLLVFWDPFIYRERLKLETSNLVCRCKIPYLWRSV